MATLKSVVHVTDDKGNAHVFGPADEVPEWAQALITNPKVWDEVPSVSRLAEPEPAKAPAKRASARRKAAPDASVHNG
ncbi:hypothetical protein [Streptomyces albipurpureus]|uniref:Uncharacterized protein n=1 Tax=Streptomyces albipurpureus TaxID=2897419 RepID=A0ABT0USY1_9ACTN|nr:hypothetical protein [Streptomyces sp. CWNU-1]MCM2391707.1 hypothetical protein [Streptomyces sp. CWNU-1]